MSNKSDKAKQAQLDAQQKQTNAEAVADRAAARTPGAVEQAQTAETTGWFDFLKDPHRDFSKAPGMAFNGMAEEGAEAAEEERTALGSMQFGASAADPNLQAVLKANVQDKRIQRRGQALNAAVERYDAQMRAQAGNLVQTDVSRRMGLAGTTTSAGASALNSYASFTPRPAWGLTLATAAIGAAGQAAGGYLGKP